jgi:hypothetical protein
MKIIRDAMHLVFSPSNYEDYRILFCNPVEVHRRFGKTYCLQFEDQIVNQISIQSQELAAFYS